MGVRLYMNPLLYAVILLSMLSAIQLLGNQLTGDKKKFSVKWLLVFVTLFLVMDIILFDYYKNGLRTVITVVLNGVFFILATNTSIVKGYIKGAIIFIFTILVEMLAQFIVIGLIPNFDIYTEMGYALFYSFNVMIFYVIYFIFRKIDRPLFNINKIRI